MTHSDLVERARKWLRTQGCGVIITEMTSGAGQEPDAIGWHPAYSVLVECKASRSDFMSDKNKGHQRTKISMGDKRYYLAPKGIIKPGEVPEKWGLLEPYGNGIKKIVYPGSFFKEKNIRGEITLLVSAMRRIKGIMPKGISARTYGVQTNCRATVSIRKPIEEKPKVTMEWLENFLDYLPIHQSIITDKNEIHNNRKERLDFVIGRFKEAGIEVEK